MSDKERQPLLQLIKGFECYHQSEKQSVECINKIQYSIFLDVLKYTLYPYNNQSVRKNMGSNIRRALSLFIYNLGGLSRVGKRVHLTSIYNHYN